MRWDLDKTGEQGMREREMGVDLRVDFSICNGILLKPASVLQERALEKATPT
jgi:hypothetical protein